MESTKEKSNIKKKKVKAIIIICIIVLAVLAITVLVFQLVNRHKIKVDIEKKITYMQRGELAWATLSGVEVSNELGQYIIGGIAENDSKSIDQLFVANNGVSYKIGFVSFGKCTVTYFVNGYDFMEFISYCEQKGVTSYEQMIKYFPYFTESSERTYVAQIEMNYVYEDGKWRCDYNQYDFLNHMSCGMVKAYEEYYVQSLQNIQMLIDMIEEDTEDETEDEE